VLALIVDALLAAVEWSTTPEPLRAAARERSRDR